MLRNFVFSENEYYHVYSRGVDKRTIFQNNSDFNRFIKLLYICNSSEHIVFRGVENTPLDEIKKESSYTAIGAYCLMNNHFHLLLKETQEYGIRDFMRKLLTAYSMYFNKKYDRSGPLFQSRFKAQHAGNDDYLKYLFAYIHLNPAKTFSPNWKKESFEDIELVKKHLSTYPYSSYIDYANDPRKEEGLILTKEVFPEYFVDTHDFNTYVEDWLQYENQTDLTY